MTQRSDGPWICTSCHKRVRKGQGFIFVMDAATRGYPRRATPTWEEANPELEERRIQSLAEGALFVLSGRELFGSILPAPTIAFDVLHLKCDPDMDTSPYWIDVERASSPQEWMQWVIHLASKTWMAKDDLARMLDFWFSNRGLEPPHP